MLPFRARALFATATLLSLSVHTVSAANISFQGAFTADDQRQLISFSLLGNTTVTLTTLGYAGGTNANSVAILRGGFDPILSLFDGTGALININNDAGCPTVNQDSVTGACWDSYIQTTLPAGIYTLALTQSDNGPNGPGLVDGFGRDGQGNFTGPTFLGSPGMFIDANPDQRDGHWAVDLLGVDSAELVSDVPEPSTWMVGGLLGLLVAFHHRRKAARLAALLIAGFGSATLQATEAPALADTYVATGLPSNNFGALGNVNVGGGNTGLLRFAITEVLPAETRGRNVAKATLKLWVNKVNTAGSIGVFRAGTAWNETTVTQGTIPTTGTPVASTVAIGATGGVVLVDVTQAVRDWVDTPAQNFGLLLTAATGAPTTSVILDSKENTATGRPAEIEITLGSGDPGIVVRDANGNYLGTWDGGDSPLYLRLTKGGFVYTILNNGELQSPAWNDLLFWSNSNCTGTLYANPAIDGSAQLQGLNGFNSYLHLRSFSTTLTSYAKHIYFNPRTNQLYKLAAGEGMQPPNATSDALSLSYFDHSLTACQPGVYAASSLYQLLPIAPADLGIVATGNPLRVATPLKFE